LKYKSFQQLSFNQWGWLWVAYWRLWPVLMRIKFKQGSWLKEKLDLSPSPLASIPGADNRFESMHESVRLAARLHFSKAACLPRSIVLADMLRARGIEARVRLGVGRDEGSLASHAWVEVDGHPIIEPQSIATDFTRIQL